MAPSPTVEQPRNEPPRSTSEQHERVHQLAVRRMKVAVFATAVMLVIYFSFILGIAFDKAAMGTLLTEGLSLGMVLGVTVIVSAFGLTAAYAWWANTIYDPALEAVAGKEGRAQ